MSKNKKYLTFKQFCKELAKQPNNKFLFEMKNGDTVFKCTSGREYKLCHYDKNDKIVIIRRASYKPKPMDDVINFNKRVRTPKSKKQQLDEYLEYLLGVGHEQE